ncbi:MAG: hypothetical protein R2824_29160 [Saprospiraceae bacterium]
MDIRFVPREEIDKVKFNSCVHYATNGNIFGYIWYLDYVAKDWDALVEGDYESVFPLVWRTNTLGKKELYQPDLMRELGIFSIHVLSAKRLQAFIEAIPDEYTRIDIRLNEQNFPIKDVPYELEEVDNFQLLLTSTYEELQSKFQPELIQALTIAEAADLLPTTSVKPEQIAKLYRQYTTRKSGLDRNYHALQRIMYNALHRGWGFASGVQNRAGELLAANFYIYSHKKVMSLVPVQSPEGKKVEALFYLFDMLLRSHAGRPLILDFNVDGDARLAQAFGGERTAYYRLYSKKQAWWKVLAG